MKQPRFRLGDIIRYGSGAPALMRVEHISLDHGRIGQHRYYGINITGSSIGAYEFDCKPTTDGDIVLWDEYKSWRKCNCTRNISCDACLTNPRDYVMVGEHKLVKQSSESPVVFRDRVEEFIKMQNKIKELNDVSIYCGSPYPKLEKALEEAKPYLIEGQISNSEHDAEQIDFVGMNIDAFNGRQYYDVYRGSPELGTLERIGSSLPDPAGHPVGDHKIFNGLTRSGKSDIATSEYHKNLTMMRDNNFGYPNGDDDELDNEEEEDLPLDEEFDYIKVKELNKIKLDPGEALVIKLPADTSYEDAQRMYEYVCQTLKTDKVLIFIGDIELSKIDYSNHAPTKRHPLYDK